MVRSPGPDRIRRHWDRQAARYDRRMNGAERMFGDTRGWVCRQATGQVLEVAVGTGLNLGLYPAHATLTGMDLSPAMIDLARRHAAELGRAVDLRVGDAQHLEFDDASFDTVVCTFGLCAVPDDRGAVDEMVRVLRPGGLLLLADHVVSTSAPLRALQAVAELYSVRVQNEHFRRRPLLHVEAAGLRVERHDRFNRGVIERLAARRPEPGPEVSPPTSPRGPAR
ncbi:class I SAM-dependent methyltransferase [Promicromonospora sp. NPDC059942]|uniref:class I SAM-dependent methyltransferase n=1 Tax=Promicromonospora sp. NPDC059942 TaxID=3347009 RepID=UPI00364EEDF0